MSRIKYLYDLVEDSESAALITSLPNIRFYLGEDFSEGTLLAVTDKEVVVFTQDKKTVANSTVIQTGCAMRELNSFLEKNSVKRLLIEAASIPFSFYSRLKSVISCEIVIESPLEEIIYDRRRVKSQDEINKIIEAQKITDNVFTEALNFIKAGMTDREIQLMVGLLFYQMGSEMLSFNHVLGCGKNTSLPHVRPTGTVAARGDLVMLDIGAKIDGYGSDMTRMVAIGSVDEEKQRVYDIVLKAQNSAIESIACGKKCCHIDAAARKIIGDAGYGQYFLHGLGHPIGSGGHEGPRFNQTDESLITPELVMTVEPGIYLPGKFGIRIEDMVYISEDKVINLTHSPKNLICV